MHAQRSLIEQAWHEIERRLSGMPEPYERVLWWDAGGHLLRIIRGACDAAGIGFSAAEGSPLTLRQKALDEADRPYVWYIPDAKDNRDWFRDIREAKSPDGHSRELELSVEQLAAKVYDAPPWQLLPRDVDAALRQQIATTLLDELSGPNRPTLSELQSKLMLGGHSRPESRFLRADWGQIERDQATVSRIRELLEETGVVGLSPQDAPDTIVQQVRRWAVAGWLLESGLPVEYLSRGADYKRSAGLAKRRLEAVLRSEGAQRLQRVYLQSFWPDAIDRVDDPWSLATCPVGGSLEAKLWEAWLSDFSQGRLDACHRNARNRANVLRSAYDDRGTHDASPWVRAWEQGADLAELARRYEAWESRGDTPVYALYGDLDNGTWHIDRAVRALIVSGTPEAALPAGHPVKEHLPPIRDQLVQDRYLSYLTAMGEEMESALLSGRLFGSEELRQTYTFWNEHKAELATGQSVALFYLDALRLDLARELAERLRGEGYEVKESLWLGTLPSKTEYGMGALTPGSPSTFEVKLERGDLRAWRHGKKLDTGYRNRLLEGEGWSVTTHAEEGWDRPRVAYFNKELDDHGEGDPDNIEQLLGMCVSRFVDIIHQAMKRGDIARAFVVTDHGFVLLPRGARMESFSPPAGSEYVKRRFAAGTHLDAKGAGVLLSNQHTPQLGYLTSPVKVLVQAQQRFEKQGITDARYMHYGALPQECVLSFLTIERTS